AKTDGVPLFVEELTKAIIECRSPSDSDWERVGVGLAPGIVPETLAGSLTARLDRVGAAKEVAQIGSTIGREFDYALLSEVAGLSSSSLQSVVAQLAATGLIYVRGEPPEATCIFKHALVQDAAYATLPVSKRRRLHSLVAQALEEKFPET